MSGAVKIDLPYLSLEENRHGNERLYVRRNGKRVRIHQAPGSPEFLIAYNAAVSQLGGARITATVTAAPPTHPKGSLGWLGALYFASKGEGEFLTLAPKHQRARRANLEDCFAYPRSDEDPEPMGNCPLKYFSAQKVKRLIEAKDGKGARVGRRRDLSALCAWGVENNHLAANPVRDVKAGRRVKGGGFYTWTIEDVQCFLAYHREQATKRSRKAILALGLLLFAGMRRQDMVDLGKQHCRGPKPDTLGDWIRYTPKKTLWRRRDVSQKPLLPILRQIILDNWDIIGDLTFLVTEQGKSFTENGIGNWFRDRCDEAGLPQCTAHGLKKAGATIAAENGATTRQLMAMFDWDSPAMAEVYSRAAEKKKLAGDAMFLIKL